MPRFTASSPMPARNGFMFPSAVWRPSGKPGCYTAIDRLAGVGETLAEASLAREWKQVQQRNA